MRTLRARWAEMDRWHRARAAMRGLGVLLAVVAVPIIVTVGLSMSSAINDLSAQKKADKVSRDEDHQTILGLRRTIEDQAAVQRASTAAQVARNVTDEISTCRSALASPIDTAKADVDRVNGALDRVTWDYNIAAANAQIAGTPRPDLEPYIQRALFLLALGDGASARQVEAAKVRDDAVKVSQTDPEKFLADCRSR